MSQDKFRGFDKPKQNWSKLPHQLIEALPKIETIGEMKIIIYTLRHTWGYQDDYKKITLDEFEKGRKEKDGSRIDSGTGLTRPTIIDGIRRAIDHGFLFEHVDTSDKARVKKFYSLSEGGLKVFTPDVKRFDSNGKDSLPRSEKETKRKKPILEPSTELFAELVFLLKMPKKLMTPKMQRAYDDFIMDLQELGAMPGDIKLFGRRWYENDWRGQKGQKPTLEQIRSEWDNLMNPQQNGKFRDSDVSDFTQDKQYKFFAELDND